MIRGEPFMRDAMLAAARAWAKAHRAKLATASWKAHGDSPFFGRLANGSGSFTVRKFDEVMAWFDDPKNWKTGTVPPEVVDLFVPQQLAKDHAP
jgi:hypothetical protein